MQQTQLVLQGLRQTAVSSHFLHFPSTEAAIFTFSRCGLVLITLSPTICLNCYLLITYFFFLRHHLLTSYYEKCRFHSLSFTLATKHMHPSFFPSSRYNYNFALIDIRYLQYDYPVSYLGWSLYSKR